MSHRLREDLYWPSFNEAFFPEIRKLSKATGAYGDYPRAQLFRLLQPNATSIEGLQFVMGWNDFKHNNISHGDPENAIAARDDLDPNKPQAEGGLDSKVTSYKLYHRGMVTFARAGPTNDFLPSFCWKGQFPDVPRYGQPECFNFSWAPVVPSVKP